MIEHTIIAEQAIELHRLRVRLEAATDKPLIPHSTVNFVAAQATTIHQLRDELAALKDVKPPLDNAYLTEHTKQLIITALARTSTGGSLRDYFTDDDMETIFICLKDAIQDDVL